MPDLPSPPIDLSTEDFNKYLEQFKDNPYIRNTYSTKPFKVTTVSSSVYDKTSKIKYEFTYKDFEKDIEDPKQQELIPKTCPTLEELQREYKKLIHWGYSAEKAAMTLMDKYEKFQTEISNYCREKESELLLNFPFKAGQYVYLNKGKYFKIKKIQLDFFEEFPKIELEEIKDKKSYDKTRWIIGQKGINKKKDNSAWRAIVKERPLYLYCNSEEFKKLKVLEDENVIKSFNSMNVRTSIFV